MKSFSRFIKEHKTLMEGTWALPKNDADVEKIMSILSKPVKAKDAKALFNLLGDDEVFDFVSELKDEDPDQDVRNPFVGFIQDIKLTNIPDTAKRAAMEKLKQLAKSKLSQFWM
jgi:hypothetical protein